MEKPSANPSSVIIVEGRISGGMKESRLVVGIPCIGVVRKGFYFNGQLIVVPKDDKGIPILKEAAKTRERLLCIFEQEEHFSHILAVYLSPKGSFKQLLNAKIEMFLLGEITARELVEEVPPKYGKDLSLRE